MLIDANKVLEHLDCDANKVLQHLDCGERHAAPMMLKWFLNLTCRVYDLHQEKEQGSFTKARSKTMARTKTGSRSGVEAFNVLMLWRANDVPEFVTSYEAWNLTGGLVGKQNDSSAMRLIQVAVSYTTKGGSVRDYLSMKASA